MRCQFCDRPNQESKEVCGGCGAPLNPAAIKQVYIDLQTLRGPYELKIICSRMVIGSLIPTASFQVEYDEDEGIVVISPKVAPKPGLKLSVQNGGGLSKVEFQGNASGNIVIGDENKVKSNNGDFNLVVGKKNDVDSTSSNPGEVKTLILVLPVGISYISIVGNDQLVYSCDDNRVKVESVNAKEI